MVKTRMGLLDLRVQTAILHKTLRGAQVLNIYNAQKGRTYILKLSIPPTRTWNKTETGSLDNTPPPGAPSSLPQPWEKRLLLLESGARIHMTQFNRDKNEPSGFCVKLRKHIRGKRLNSVVQLGNGGDRIIDLTFFGDGVVVGHLIIEGFAGGNVILTDQEYTILTLLRVDKTKGDGETDIVAVRERYPVEKARKRTIIDKPYFDAAVKRAIAAIPDQQALDQAQGRHMRKKMQARALARRALAYEIAIEPSFLEHALVTSGFDSEISMKELSEKGTDVLYTSLEALETTLMNQMTTGIVKGYIILKVNEVNGVRKEEYADFTPFLFKQHETKSYNEFPTFDAAVDEFFTKVESQRADAAQAKREAATFKKVDKLAAGLEGQVKIFENTRDLSRDRARAIEKNLVEVDAAIKVVSSAIAASVPWDALVKMVEKEKKNENKIAQIIHSLQLDKNQITLHLNCSLDDDEIEGENEPDMDSDDDLDDNSFGERSEPEVETENEAQSSAKEMKSLQVPVILSLTAHANARRHYEQQKNASSKMQKAVEVTDQTVKTASKKAAIEAKKLENQAMAASIKARRVPFWFEKFHWFISSENYLIVAGRDPQQNELLVKRYMGPADIYMNADLDGAASVVVKNRREPTSQTYDEIPSMTLEQAGTYAVCRSSAWDGKFITSAWWVRAGQVSKTIGSGEHLPSGSFYIRGKKTFMNPTQLVMGIAFIFKIDEACALHHKGERCVRGSAAVDEDEKGAVLASISAVRNVSNEEPVSDLAQSIPSEAKIEPLKHSAKTQVDVFEATSQMEDGNSVNPISISTNVDMVALHGKPEKGNFVELPSSGTEAVHSVSESEDEKAKRTTRKYLSAKERRLRKQERTGSTSAVSDQNVQTSKPAAKNKTTAGASGASNPKGAVPLPRGKKHKLKKIRKKYMDQDEEQRAIALTLLGSKPVKQMESQTETGTSDNDDFGSGQEEQDLGESEKKPRRRRIEKQEDLRLSYPEGVRELERLEREYVEVLHLLTAIPRVEDAIQYALPVCAPYSTVSNYRYRVKVMPGNTKRGKGYRTAAAVMLHQAEKDLTTFKDERDAMRLAPDTDGVALMLGNVKLVARGLAEVQKSISKASKKKK